jgi:UDP-3-O-[3-hydroxymyristoyl] N-acetylglucosamine deacetylase
MKKHHAQLRLFRQTTLARSTSIDGVGIHTGKTVRLRLLPAPPDTGLRFRRVDAGGIEIAASPSHVTSLELATTLGRDDVNVSTVEHLLAALYMARVDNLVIEIDGPEIPILDGSALPYCRLVEAAGLTTQNALRRVIVVTQPVEASLGDKWIRVSPYPGLRISYGLDYGLASIGRQSVDLPMDADHFLSDLAPARTFALASDVERLHRQGLGLGGREDNCIVFTAGGPLNTTLRFDDEPVRHKALDLIGDIALLGSPIWGHFEVERGGHLLHFRMVEALQRHPECWTWAHIDQDAAVTPGLYDPNSRGDDPSSLDDPNSQVDDHASLQS